MFFSLNAGFDALYPRNESNLIFIVRLVISNLLSWSSDFKLHTFPTEHIIQRSLIACWCSDWASIQPGVSGASLIPPASLCEQQLVWCESLPAAEKADLKLFHSVTEAADLDCAVISVLLLVSAHRWIESEMLSRLAERKTFTGRTAHFSSIQAPAAPGPVK